MRWNEGGQLQTNPVATTEEIFENFFQKPLEKIIILWYNLDTIKKENKSYESKGFTNEFLRIEKF